MSETTPLRYQICQQGAKMQSERIKVVIVGGVAAGPKTAARLRAPEPGGGHYPHRAREGIILCRVRHALFCQRGRPGMEKAHRHAGGGGPGRRLFPKRERESKSWIGPWPNPSTGRTRPSPPFTWRPGNSKPSPMTSSFWPPGVPRSTCPSKGQI